MNKKLIRFSVYASLITVLIAIAVIAGWIFDASMLTNLSPGFVSMKFNTAIGFLFLGTSLFFFHQNEYYSVRFLSAGLAFIVLLIALLNSAQYIFGMDLGIDELLIKEQPGAVATHFPGRMAPGTAFGLVVAAFSMLILNFRTRRFAYVSQILVFGLVLFNFIPLLGYILNRPQLYGVAGHTYMALHTSFLLVIAGTGILTAFPGAGLVSLYTRGSLGGQIARKVIPKSVLLTVFMIIVLLGFEISGMFILFNDIQLISLLLITGFITFLIWILKSVEVIDKNRAKAIDQVHFANEQILHHIENSPLGMIEWDNHLRVKLWSWQAEELFGWKAEEAINKHVDDLNFIHEDDKMKVDRIIGELLSDNNSRIVMSNRNYHKNGEVLHCVWYNSVMHDSRGKVVSILSQVHNVTEQKKTESLLAESEEQYRSLIDITREGIFINQDDRIVFINPAAMKLFGAGNQEQVLGKSIYGFFHPDQHDLIRERIKEVLKGETLPMIEQQIVSLDGQTVYVEVAATSFVFNKRPAILVVARDVTDRNRALKELRRNEFLLRIAGNLAQVGGWMVNLPSYKIYWSNQVAAIHEMPPGFFPLMDNAYDFVAPEYRDKMRELFTDCINSGKPFDTELQVITGKGRRRWVRIIGIAEHDPGGNIINIMGGIQDISDRKDAEEEIKKLNEGLERKVRERTAQLEASNKELEAFSYSVSHDLRAPLRAINGFTRILLEDHASRLDRDGKKICYTVMDNSRKMGQLIDELLAFSQLGRRAIKLSQIDMNRMVASVYKEVTTPGERKKLDFKVEELCPAWGDAGMIRQVWVNLISNAVKFTAPVKGPRIRIYCTKSQDHCTYLAEDNGVGFDMKYAGRIFDVFQRLHSAKNFEGSGVGLAIVQRIIHRHGGSVEARGKAGKGACFSFSLPPAKSELEAAGLVTGSKTYAP
jgi:PAS domain S-box-containing protein